jgi:hypothetical protein
MRVGLALQPLLDLLLVLSEQGAPWLTDTSQLRDSRDSQLRSVTVG